MLGMQVYSVQFTTLMRGVVMLVLGVLLVRCWRAFTPDADIGRLQRKGG